MSEYKCPQCGAAFAAEKPWPCPACSYGSESASSGGYAFERWIPPITHQGRKSKLDGMVVGEVRVFSEPRKKVYQWLKNRSRFHPEKIYSWATDKNKTAVRRDA